MESGPVAIEPIEKFHNGDLVGINRGAALQLSNQLRASDLCLSLSPLEAMPAALSPASHRIMVIKNDCPATG
jgi:hypothetical protein